MQDNLAKSEKLKLLDVAGFSLDGQTKSKPVEQKDDVKPSDFSDTGNAEVFERIYKHSAKWTKGGGWFVWDGLRWEQNDHRALSLARDLSGQMLKDALGEYCEAQKKVVDLNNSLSEPDLVDTEAVDRLKKDLTSTKGYLSHAQKTRQKARTDAMLGLAQAGLWAELADFDQNPFALNTPGGIVDLTTGRMHQHMPVAMCSKITKVAPGDVGREIWRDFLRLITQDDPKLENFLQQIAGMSVVGRVYQESLIISYGCGRNGKSTFFNALAAVLGTYAGGIDPEALTTSKLNKSHDLAELRGQRLVIASELEEGKRLSTSMLKRLSSTDKIVAERKYRDPESFTPSHSLVLHTNHLPKVGSTDGGTWRRIILVPFNAKIPPSSDIKNYAEKLVNEAGGAILQWIIEGAVNFYKAGCTLAIPDVVAEATEQYESDSDWLSAFIA